MLSGTSLTAAFNGMTQGFAFHVTVPAGQTGTLTVVIAFYRSAVVDSRISGSYYYTSLFGSIDSVIDSAFAGFADARVRCQQLASAMANAGLNPYRQFLACHALHSYMANTACLIDPSGGVALAGNGGVLRLHQHVRPDGGPWPSTNRICTPGRCGTCWIPSRARSPAPVTASTTRFTTPCPARKCRSTDFPSTTTWATGRPRTRPEPTRRSMTTWDRNSSRIGFSRPGCIGAAPLTRPG